jgi:hypothetical protein
MASNGTLIEIKDVTKIFCADGKRRFARMTHLPLLQKAFGKEMK